MEVPYNPLEEIFTVLIFMCLASETTPIISLCTRTCTRIRYLIHWRLHPAEIFMGFYFHCPRPIREKRENLHRAKIPAIWYIDYCTHAYVRCATNNA